MSEKADVIIIGAGLAGLVAACELIDEGKRIMLIDQEPRQNLGGQAFWSLGGLFMVNTPEQRRLGIRDSYDLAMTDWMGTAGFDRPEDHWPRQWAKAYVEFAAGEKRSWLKARGVSWFPIVGWAERGGYGAIGHGNSVPRFHITWGTGPGVIAPFVARVLEAEKAGRITLKFRHAVTSLIVEAGTCVGVAGDVYAPSDVERGAQSTREVVGGFEARAEAVIVASGGIGGNHDLVRRNWPARLGSPPRSMISGVPHHVDGRMLDVAMSAGASLINPDRMWHYVEGIRNFAPIWPMHAIRILPGPSSMWFSATGDRFPAPYLPGFDTLGTLDHIMKTGYDYSWFILNQSIIRKEFALSGSEQNPDLTGKDWLKALGRAIGKSAPAPVEAFKRQGADFVVRDTIEALVAGMNAVAGDNLLNVDQIRAEIIARDGQIDNSFAKDMQIIALRGARAYIGDRLIRTAKPHKILDPKHGPLIAVKLNVLTRKTLGGLETNLEGQVLCPDGALFPGLYAAGEAAGFGGGGVHGYRSLEGTFLGGCIFSGRAAGRALRAMG
jgi:predicted oxidoreductase